MVYHIRSSPCLKSWDHETARRQTKHKDILIDTMGNVSPTVRVSPHCWIVKMICVWRITPRVEELRRRAKIHVDRMPDAAMPHSSLNAHAIVAGSTREREREMPGIDSLFSTDCDESCVWEIWGLEHLFCYASHLHHLGCSRRNYGNQHFREGNNTILFAPHKIYDDRLEILKSLVFFHLCCLLIGLHDKLSQVRHGTWESLTNCRFQWRVQQFGNTCHSLNKSVSMCMREWLAQRFWNDWSTLPTLSSV